MSNKQLLMAIMVLAIVTVSCKSKKGLVSKEEPKIDKPTKVDSKGLVLEQTLKNQNYYGFYTATGELEYIEGKNNQELGITITMEKDQYVMMNVTAVMGIAVARVLATQDSLVILDMLHRKAIITNYEYLKKFTGVDLKLQQLQNLLSGNTLFAFNAQAMRLDTVNGRLHMSQQIEADLIQSTQYSDLFKVAQTSMYQVKKKQQLDVDYREFHNEGNNRFPSTIHVNIQSEKTLETEFRLKTFSFEKKKELQFSIPKSYEIVRL